MAARNIVNALGNIELLPEQKQTLDREVGSGGLGKWEIGLQVKSKKLKVKSFKLKVKSQN